jgi:L-amino acid N-acyltransferase YncA
MAEDIAKERALASAKATAEIERIYNRAVNSAFATLNTALQEARTWTRPSDINDTQQGYIARLERLKVAIEEGAKNPLGTFNWDFA